MKSDREFIAGIYEKAAVLQAEQPIAGTDDAKISFFEKFNVLRRPYAVGLAFVAVCFIVIVAGVNGVFSRPGIDDISNVTQQQPQVFVRSNENAGLMTLSEMDIQFEVSVTVKDIVSGEDTVKIECIAKDNADGRFVIGEEFVVTMTAIEYENTYPEGMAEGKVYTFTVYDTEDGFRVIPFIK